MRPRLGLLPGIVMGALQTISITHPDDASVTEGQPTMANGDVTTVRLRSAVDPISRAWSRLTGQGGSATPAGVCGAT